MDGVDKDGKPAHSEWTGKFDGKEYPVTGNPISDMRSYKMIDAHKLGLTETKGGKVTVSGHIELSHDGKTRTVDTKATDASGKRSQQQGGLRQAVVIAGKVGYQRSTAERALSLHFPLPPTGGEG